VFLGLDIIVVTSVVSTIVFMAWALFIFTQFLALKIFTVAKQFVRFKPPIFPIILILYIINDMYAMISFLFSGLIASEFFFGNVLIPSYFITSNYQLAQSDLISGPCGKVVFYGFYKFHPLSLLFFRVSGKYSLPASLLVRLGRGIIAVTCLIFMVVFLTSYTIFIFTRLPVFKISTNKIMTIKMERFLIPDSPKLFMTNRIFAKVIFAPVMISGLIAIKVFPVNYFNRGYYLTAGIFQIA